MATFTKDFTRMRNDLDEARRRRRERHQEIRAEIRHMTEGLQGLLGRFAVEMRARRAGLRESADRVRKELRRLSTDLRAGGLAFRSHSID